MGGLYGLLALGLGLTWGVLRVINLAHFSITFLSAYLTYHLATVAGLDPLATALVTVPAAFAAGAGLAKLFEHLKLDTSRSLIFTFGLFVIFENVSKLIWAADYRRIPLDRNPYFIQAFSVAGGWVTLPLVPLLGFAVAALAAGAIYLGLHRTFPGKGVRAAVQDPEMAAAFGVNFARLAPAISGVSSAAAAAAGTFIGMTYTLFPSAAEQWIGVIFSVVILGGLGNPLGCLGAGMLLGVVEALTQTVADPALARLVSLGVLALALLFRPQGLFAPLVPEVER